MISRDQTLKLLKQYVKSPQLQNHCLMVGAAMEAYAKLLGVPDEEIEMWWTTGTLHDLDWEKFPDEHPNKSINEILPDEGYGIEIIKAIKSHAPERTGRSPETRMEKYLFACDEICGFLNAVALVRPTGFAGMKWQSVKKKLKTNNFAAGVVREDIHTGSEMIGIDLIEHVAFLIDVFNEWKPQ